jgi:lipopolysaccharide/colanic/teichoic acid biosynthesis glycosyltransferase
VCVVFASIVFSPFFVIVYIAIRREDGGPAIFKQERIGKGGKPFMLYKFRSMKVDAESNGKPQLWAGGEDERLTKVGKFIREHHLDELPQFLNIWKGDMSFVGYRPERQYFIDKIVKENPDYVKLYAMRPGVFSNATLYNGYTDTMEKMLTRLDMDLEYLENHNLWIDITIIFKTGISILTGKKF